MPVPVFAIMFLVFVVINSIGVVPPLAWLSKIFPGWVFADPQRLVVGEAIGRHGQVVRRRDAPEDAAGKIVL